MAEFRLETERLVLREWRKEDKEPLFAMAQDPEVMRYLPGQTREQSDAAIGRMIATQAEVGFCLWAVEKRETGTFIGFCGLLPARSPLCEVEIGWRFVRACWGKGLAREAAQACLEWAWRTLDERSIVAITVPANERSWGLMIRLGMERNADEDFDHPDLPEGDPLRRHVLYRIERPA